MSRRVYYIILSAWCISFCAQAQYTSRLGRFQIDQKKGCTPLSISITIIPPSQCNAANPCDMFFGDTPVAQNLIFTHTYTQPGTYTLQILFQTLGFDDIQVIVTPNTPPLFDLYSCANNEVQANITDTSYDQYFVNFNDGSPEVGPVISGTKVDHLYAASGNQTVSVRGRNLNPIPPGGVAADNCTPATKPITAIPTLPAPAITQLQVVDNATVQLDFNAQQDILYRLEIATNSASSFQLYKMIYNVTTETISNLRPDDNFYCFRLGVFDPCNNSTVYSPVICSSNFDLSIQNNANNLTWATSAAGITNFRLTRDTPGSTLTTTVTGSAYSDSNISCGVNYCYQLVTNYPNGSQSISLQRCGTAISTDIPAAVENITVSTLLPNEADIRWQQVVNFTPAEFTVHKSINGQYNQLGTTTNLLFTDPGYQVAHESCYQIDYKDVCNNQSPRSTEACPIILSGALQKDNTVDLEWSHYLGWRNGVSEYIVEKYSESGSLLLSSSVGTAVSFSDDSQDLSNQVYFYVVRANANEGGLMQAISNRITIIKNPNIFHPTAFTPNGDNLNDTFNVFGQYITAFEMNIFNRWGELMYSTTVLDLGWDGTYRGNPMPEGTYTFVADITDRAGRTFTKSGSVLLLRRGK